MNNLENSDWRTDVEIESDRLIKDGVPPWEAAEQAAKNIRLRRRRAALREDGNGSGG